VRRRPLSENILAGGAGGHGAEALVKHSRLLPIYQSCRALDPRAPVRMRCAADRNSMLPPEVPVDASPKALLRACLVNYNQR
jgi:hypothetical protein